MLWESRVWLALGLVSMIGACGAHEPEYFESAIYEAEAVVVSDGCRVAEMAADWRMSALIERNTEDRVLSMHLPAFPLASGGWSGAVGEATSATFSGAILCADSSATQHTTVATLIEDAGERIVVNLAYSRESACDDSIDPPDSCTSTVEVTYDLRESCTFPCRAMLGLTEPDMLSCVCD